MLRFMKRIKKRKKQTIKALNKCQAHLGALCLKIPQYDLTIPQAYFRVVNNHIKEGNTNTYYD